MSSIGAFPDNRILSLDQQTKFHFWVIFDFLAKSAITLSKKKKWNLYWKPYFYTSKSQSKFSNLIPENCDLEQPTLTKDFTLLWSSDIAGLIRIGSSS